MKHCLALFIVLSACATHAQQTCLVVGITDGDTLTARCGMPGKYEQIKVRLAAIDAPEKAQPYGEASRQSLAKLCFQQQATIAPRTKDLYGRTMADVKCKGQDVGEAQIRTGMAWVYTQYAAGYALLPPLQANAQQKKLGLWAGTSPVAPWEFRRPTAAATATPMRISSRRARSSQNGTCHTGPRGGRYTITAGGSKHYGC